MTPSCESTSRRSLLRALMLGAITSPALSILGCARAEPLLRIASNVWPGYELIYLARDKGFFSEGQIRLAEVPSATVCLQLLAAGSVEGAMLTLDEVLLARSEGLELRVVAVLDESLGGDVLLAQPAIESLEQLKGRRVGVEQSAVGAVMMDAVLQKAGLAPQDVEAVYMTVNKHHDAFVQGEVDAVISFEPVRSQLLKQGALQLFSSAEIPGRIIDVLAVLPSAIDASPQAISTLVAAHFQARQFFVDQPEQASVYMAKRLQLPPADVPGSFEGIALPDLVQNRRYLQGDEPSLLQSASDLARILAAAQLLSGDVSLDRLAEGRFL